MGITTKTTKGTKGTKGKGTPVLPPNKGGVTVGFTPPVPVTPQQRRGKSTCKNPVPVCWVFCLQSTHNNGGTPNSRGYLHKGCMGLGVTYYTVRTQVQQYLKWFRLGCNPTTLPKGITIPKGLVLTPPTPPRGRVTHLGGTTGVPPYTPTRGTTMGKLLQCLRCGFGWGVTRCVCVVVTPRKHPPGTCGVCGVVHTTKPQSVG